ncbi:MAG: TauD/TfdA family dioxygenase [Alphaproteobacteria bacterium]|nr:TauD/TfdA family dioxygenase [Alphaproteobacteria bacterium]
MFQTIDITPLTGAIGAEVGNVDFSRPLSERQLDEIDRAFMDYLVIVFRDQDLTPQKQVEVARHFGTPAIYPFLKGHDEAPEVSIIAKGEADTVNFGGRWHSDTSYKPCPDMATLLYAVDVPDAGGDTLFANLYLAYESLSDGMKDMLDGLTAIYSSEKGYAGKRAETMKSIRGMTDAVAPEVETFESEHPVVRTHPVTGRKALYVSRSHTLRFRNMTVEESEPLINYLSDFAVRPEFTCRLRWQRGTLAVWDNRCTNHFAVNDYFGKARRMHRVTLQGDRPR